MITKTLAGLPVPPWVTLLLVMALIFLLGWPFEWPAIIFVFLPIFYPDIEAMKYDMLRFGALVRSISRPRISHRPCRCPPTA